MERREFLKLCATSAGGLALFGPELLAESPGVSAETIKIGMSAAFRGASAGLGSEYYRGSLAFYEKINAAGGIFGRKIQVIAKDDGYEPAPAIQNTIDLIEKEQVFILSNYVGTPTLTRALPVIQRYRDQGLLLVGNFTGAQPQREPPYRDQVFNIRASYRQEMAALVERFHAAGVRQFGVFYQIDAYGRSGTDGVLLQLEALEARGSDARLVAEATYRRGARFDEDMTPAVEHLRAAGAEAVLCTGAYQGCAAFIRTARARGFAALISNVSFVGCDPMLRLLVDQGIPTDGLINSQVVPSYDAADLATVADYRQQMKNQPPSVPAELQDPNYHPEEFSFISLEGFINAKVICEALTRAGRDLTRPGFRAALESLRDYDLGIGAPLNFGPDQHQGLNQVYFTVAEKQRWIPVNDLELETRVRQLRAAR